VPLISYAQNFEDVLLWRALGGLPQGLYIDIGAQDPTLDSVSRAFYEHGWRGIHVEASAAYCDLLRRDRPDEQVIQAAIGAEPGLLTFYEFPGTGLSTALESIADQHREAGWPVTMTQVPCLTLDALFDGIGPKEVHWLKIDVEGYEHLVIKGWRISPMRPWIVLVEAVAPFGTHPTHETYEDALCAKGYHCVHFDGLNRYYVSDEHPDLDRHFQFGPSLWDEIQVPKESRLAQHLLEQHRQETTALQQENTAHMERLESEIRAKDVAEEQRQQLERDVEQLRAELNSAVERHDVARKQLDQTLDLFSAANAQCERLAVELGAAELRHDETRGQLNRALESLSDVEVQRVQLTAELGVANQQLADADTARRHSEAEIAAQSLQTLRLAGHLDAISSSLWWRMAKPFRSPSFDLAMDVADLEVAGGSRSQDRNGAWARSIDELILRGDRDFVESAYLTLLGRAADDEGLCHYLDLLAEGWSRERVICDLRLSPEGKAFPADTPGLMRLMRRNNLLGIPVIGSILRVLGLRLVYRSSIRFAAPSDVRAALLDEDIRRLLRRRSDDFLRAAYTVVLGRLPDPDGERHFMRRLEQGGERLDILASLRWSSEGRSRGPVTGALAIATNWYRWRRFWPIGSFLHRRALRRFMPLVAERLATIVAELDHLDEIQGTGIEAAGHTALGEQAGSVPTQALPASDELGLRVAILTTWNVQCGIATHSAELIGAFEDADVRIYAADQFPLLSDDGPEVFRLWHVGKGGNRLFAVLDHLRNSPVDLLLVQFNYGFFEHAALAEFIESVSELGIVVMVILHSTVDPMGDAPNWRVEELVPGLRRCGRVIVHASGDVSRLAAMGLSDNVLLLPHGVVVRDIERLQRVHGDAPILSTFGFCLPNKGLVELVQAIGILHNRGIHVRLKMLNAVHPDPSSTETMHAILEAIAGLGLSSVIEFIPDYLDFDKVDEMIAQTDLFVNPYQQTGESASGAVRIGLRTRRPTIVTPLPIFDDLGAAVFRMPGTAPQEMANGIATALRHVVDGTEEAQCVASALDEWLALHDFRRQARRLSNICRSLQLRKGKGAFCEQ
jgi:FkbM family methyltransferase